MYTRQSCMLVSVHYACLISDCLLFYSMQNATERSWIENCSLLNRTLHFLKENEIKMFYLNSFSLFHQSSHLYFPKSGHKTTTRTPWTNIHSTKNKRTKKLRSVLESQTKKKEWFVLRILFCLNVSGPTSKINYPFILLLLCLSSENKK